MKTNNLSTFAILCGTFIALALIQHGVQAQTKNAPVTVTNTTANPVPVTGGVTVTNTPTVDAKQSGTWNVGINGTPTVKFDPNPSNNKVLVYGDDRFPVAVTYNRVEDALVHNWADGAFTNQVNLGAVIKALVCVKSEAPNAAVITVATEFFVNQVGRVMAIDTFGVGNGETVCKPYDINGASVWVSGRANGNTTGRVTIGAVGISLSGRN